MTQQSSETVGPILRRCVRSKPLDLGESDSPRQNLGSPPGRCVLSGNCYNTIQSMAQEKPNRVVEWMNLLRRQYPVLRGHFMDWVAACREQPQLIWETVAVRYASYAIGGMLGIWALTTLVGWFVPPPPPSAQAAANSADYHVICTSAKCMQHFVIQRKFGFSSFPVACPACKQQTGTPARRCHSAECNGQWSLTVEREGRTYCAHCGRVFE